MEVRLERAAAGGLYAAPPASDGIFVSTVRLLVRQAARTPALARRKVFVVGDADRMVPVEGSEFAANAFLKLLEEPPADTWIIVTTSAVGALLPTIRSRLVAVRVPALDDASMREFLADEAVSAALRKLDVPDSPEQRLLLAQGAPGRLLSARSHSDAMRDATRMLEAALSGRRADLLRLALTQSQSGARGAFSEMLDALTIALHQRMRDRAQVEDDRATRSAGQAIDLVEEAKRLAEGNVSPQLITARLLADLTATLA
jgi:DNA polymerase-3 subunit delta'